MLHLKPEVTSADSLRADQMQQPENLTFGFHVLGESRDLLDILHYCHASRLGSRGTWQGVQVPASDVPAFLKIMHLVQAVEDLHGFTARGRVPLKIYLDAHGIETGHSF